jgi:hypothetical protein
MAQALTMSRLGRAVAVRVRSGCALVVLRMRCSLPGREMMLTGNCCVQIGRSTGLCRAFATTTTGVGGKPLPPPRVCHGVEGTAL